MQQRTAYQPDSVTGCRNVLTAQVQSRHRQYAGQAHLLLEWHTASAGRTRFVQDLFMWLCGVCKAYSKVATNPADRARLLNPSASRCHRANGLIPIRTILGETPNTIRLLRNMNGHRIQASVDQTLCDPSATSTQAGATHKLIQDTHICHQAAWTQELFRDFPARCPAVPYLSCAADVHVHRLRNTVTFDPRSSRKTLHWIFTTRTVWLFCLFQLRNDVNIELSRKFPSASCLRKCSIHQADKHSGPFTALKRLARLNFELLPNAKVVPSSHMVLESEFNRGIVLLCDIEKSMLFDEDICIC